MRFKILCATLAVPAIAAAVGLHIHAGLAAIGDIEATYTWGPWVVKGSEPLGNSYYVGGGVDVPLWRYAGVVSPEFSLGTDVGFTSKTKQLEHEELLDFELSWKTVAIRGSFVFGVGVGPVKPFVGFGGGVAIVPWAFTYIPTGTEIDSQTEVKAAFGIPFGCEFRLTANVALGARAEYAVITGEASPEVSIENVHTLMPDPFLLTGVARVDF